MCGIVGVLGSGPVAGPIVEALKRLEYRGYDSAGHRHARARQAGAPARRGQAQEPRGQARRRAARRARSASATPAGRRTAGRPRPTPIRTPRAGSPSSTTASSRTSRRCGTSSPPRAMCSRPRPIPRSPPSWSRTNSRRARRPHEAVHAALGRLRGAFALVYLFEGEDNLLIGARQGAPLAVGYGEGEMFLGSDALALAPFTDRVAYLEDGDWVVLTREGRGHPRRLRQAGQAARPAQPGRQPAGGKGQLPPLHGQGDPRAAGGRRPYPRPLSRHGGDAAQALRLAGRSGELARMSIVGCGTAYMAGLVGKYWIERFARVPVEVDVASEYRYREAPVDKGGLTIVVSQSGETADTLACLRYVKEKAQDDRRRQCADVEHRAADRRLCADACRSRDRRRLDQGLHLPARGACRAGDRPRPRARDDRRGERDGARRRTHCERRAFSPRR